MKPEELYQNVLKARSEFFEANDCTVKAIAIATGEGYDMAHYALECAGRKARKGTSLGRMKEALNLLGYTWHRMKREDFSARTPISLEREALPGNYIVSFNTHVAAVIDGEILDWCKGRRFRIEALYKVTRQN
jgi:hypothetical protein